MTWATLQFSIVIYLLGLIWLHRQRWGTPVYIWGALGFTFVVLHTAALANWHHQLAITEAHHVQRLMALAGTQLDFVDEKILLVPDPDGWTGLNITLECSTLIELSVFAGLLLFYPRLTLQRRWRYFLIGMVLTYVLNLLRIIVIIAMVMVGGRTVIPIAHNVVARLFYFMGILSIYWFLLTRPTLHMIRRSIETHGLGVD